LGKLRIFILVFILSSVCFSSIYGQEPTGSREIKNARQMSRLSKNSDAQKQSAKESALKLANDSLVVDSLAVDSLKTEEVGGFDAEVEYKADGYITFSNTTNKIFMYENAEVKYKDIELKAQYIELNRDSNLIYAIGKPDSTGTIVGKPIFKQGDQEFEADELKYNFKTKKGIVTGVVTEQEGGFVHSGRTKLINDSIY
jgi:lipopolysaccharide assembly outer membrane protein LptD (OstA)